MMRFTLPRDMYYGKGALEDLKNLSGKKAIVVSGGSSMRKGGFLDQIEGYLKEAGMEVRFFEGVEPDPSVETVMRGAKAMQEFEPDWIVAIGGGSPIDAAKAMWAFYEHPDTTFEDLIVPFNFPKLRTKAHFCAIPTTSGTATEVTAFSVITDYSKGIKYPLADFEITPDVAILDPVLVASLPAKQVAYTGMDALTHAVEAYIGHSNTKDTSEKAEVATKLIFENLEEAYKNGKDLHAREQMLLASHYAGIAFTRAYVGNVHAIAHNLGGFYGVPHGLANAIILPYVLDFYGETAYERLARLCECAGVAKAGQTDEQKALDFIQAIRDMNARMNIPDKIEKIQEKDIETIAKRACKEANPLYPVPRIMDLDDCIAIIHRLMP